MQGFQLQFFMEQNRRHRHQLVYEWLLETARARGIRGATVFMGAMGFGQHRRVHAAVRSPLLRWPAGAVRRDRRESSIPAR